MSNEDFPFEINISISGRRRNAEGFVDDKVIGNYIPIPVIPSSGVALEATEEKDEATAEAFLPYRAVFLLTSPVDTTQEFVRANARFYRIQDKALDVKDDHCKIRGGSITIQAAVTEVWVETIAENVFRVTLATMRNVLRGQLVLVVLPVNAEYAGFNLGVIRG